MIEKWKKPEAHFLLPLLVYKTNEEGYACALNFHHPTDQKVFHEVASDLERNPALLATLEAPSLSNRSSLESKGKFRIEMNIF